MARKHNTWTLDGRPCVREAPNHFELELGIAPSRGVVTMKESDAQAIATGNNAVDLVWEDTVKGNTVTISGLYVERVEPFSPAREGQESVVLVRLHDDRALGQYRRISGYYNHLREDRSSYLAPTINGASAWTFDELLQKIIDKLGWGITASTGITWVPQNVTWEWTPAPDALEALLREVGWSVIRQPDGTYELVDLGESSSFTPADKPHIIAHTKKPTDQAHKTPSTVRLAFRVLRARGFTFEAVMQHDGQTADNSDAATPQNQSRGVWDTIANVLGEWNVTAEQVNKAFYAKRNSNGWDQIVESLGGDDLGHTRMAQIRRQWYRYFRLKDTDRDKILPLASMNPTASAQTGREVWLEPQLQSVVSWHKIGHGLNKEGKPGKEIVALRDETGFPPYPIRVVNTREGIIEFQTPGNRPLMGVSHVRNTGHVEQDWDLVANETVRVIVGYWKKFTTSDFEDDYYIVSQDVGGETNGETLTMRVPDPYIIETYDTGAGDFTKVNQATIDAAAQAFLAQHIRKYDVPDPEEWVYGGVSPDQKLTADLNAIRWEAQNGEIRTTLRAWEPFGASRNATSPADRAKQFVLRAKEQHILTPSQVPAGGGAGASGGGGDLGSFENAGPLIKDHGSGQRAGYQGYDDPEGGFVGPAHDARLLVAEDWTQGEEESPCEGAPQTTKSAHRKGQLVNTPSLAQVTKSAGVG